VCHRRDGGGLKRRCEPSTLQLRYAYFPRVSHCFCTSFTNSSRMLDLLCSPGIRASWSSEVHAPPRQIPGKLRPVTYSLCITFRRSIQQFIAKLSFDVNVDMFSAYLSSWAVPFSVTTARMLYISSLCAVHCSVYMTCLTNDRWDLNKFFNYIDHHQPSRDAQNLTYY
jgi:hypothetical protein